MINVLITLFILVLVGSILWYVVVTLVPIGQPFKNILLAILALIFVLVLLGMVFGGLPMPVLIRN
jgi:hypothetical protein